MKFDLRAYAYAGQIVNETYGVVQVDAQGRLDWVAAPPDACWTSMAEREQIRAALRPTTE